MLVLQAVSIAEWFTKKLLGTNLLTHLIYKDSFFENLEKGLLLLNLCSVYAV